ncbi:MAG: MerR family transcriptional regulator [Candidatus Nanopelagicales bacterium]
MSTSTEGRTYSIKEAATLTGLPASTLRYYESIGVIPPIGRGASSGHRVYDERDLDQLMSIACLAATGMSIGDMRQYAANNRLGRAAVDDQVALLTAQAERLAREAEQLEIRRRYVAIKVDYWHAVEADDQDAARTIAARARELADTLTRLERAG